MLGGLRSGSKRAQGLGSADKPTVEKSRTREDQHSAQALETGSESLAHFFL